MKALITSLLFATVAFTANGQTERPTQQPVPPGDQASTGSPTETGPTSHKRGWSYDPDAGMVLQNGDFRWTSWGYGEYVFRVDGQGFWRRVRQGMEFALPRYTTHYRSAIVYEVDFTDSNFFRDRSKLNIAENFYVTVQDADDPGKTRVLFGENTHILSREDNLSSGNLPTINRSLILEEHGSVHSFGTQFGVELFKSFTPRYTVAIAALDNRGSLNTPGPRYVAGNDVAVKATGLLLNNENRGRRLNVGVGLDHTLDIRNGTWTFISAVAGEPLGHAPASGNELTLEGDINYTDHIGKHSYTLESEHLYSDFSKTKTHIYGGYFMTQLSVLNSPRTGDLDPFARYDWVYFSARTMPGAITQQSLRVGFNWNLPKTRKLINFHLEYARNSIDSPADTVSFSQSHNELGLELRFSSNRYVRH